MISAFQVGSGKLRPAAMKDAIRDLERDAGIKRAKKLRTVDQLRAAGVEVIFEQEGGEN
jgi:hypothetical protein